MGQVELVRDNDIRRTVAVKRLLPGTLSEAALLRFADEVRVVGQLEHPGIVPIYDVGRDDNGQVYLVMKHLRGETMEDVIYHLRIGDGSYRARFTPEYRMSVFLRVLDAIQYAHARGILHRDIKPANIMIGPFGEVTMLDWGIAKPIRGAMAQDAHPLESTLVDSHDERLVETRLGSLAGTPLYMSPEQAAGKNDELDERSDVFSLAIVLYEWLTLRHPLRHKKTVTEVLASIMLEDHKIHDLRAASIEANVPMEYLWALVKGLARNRDDRYRNVKEMEDAIRHVLDGDIRVQCHVTLAKSVARGFARWVDRHMVLYTWLLGITTASVVAGLAVGVWKLVAR